MSYTKYGEFVRILRIRHHQKGEDMARILETTKPFMSVVENGAKYVPVAWVDKLINHYQLNEAEQEELRAAVAENRDKYTLVTTGAGPVKRRAAMELALAFPDMGEAKSQKLLDLLAEED